MDCWNGPDRPEPGERRARPAKGLLEERRRKDRSNRRLYRGSDERFAQEHTAEGQNFHRPMQSRSARPSVPPGIRGVTSDGWQWLGKPIRYDVHYRFSRDRACVEFRISVYEDEVPHGTGLTGASDDPTGWSMHLDIQSLRRAYTVIEESMLFPAQITIAELGYAQRLRTEQFFEMWRKGSADAEQELADDWHRLVAYHLRRWEVRDGPRSLFHIRAAFASGRTSMASAKVFTTAATAHRLRYHGLKHTLADQIYTVDLATSDPITGVLTSAWGGDRKLDVSSLPPLKVQVQREAPRASWGDADVAGTQHSSAFGQGDEAFLDEWREDCDGPLRACSVQ